MEARSPGRGPAPRARLLLAAALVGVAATAQARPHVDPDAMAEVLRSADHFASGRAIAHYLAGRRSMREGDWAGAAESFRLAVTYDEGSPELRVSLAEALALAGRIEAAETEARRALQLSRSGPAASEAHLLLAEIAGVRRDLETEILELRQAIRIEAALTEQGGTPDPEPWSALAAAYLEAGDEPAAWRTLEELAVRLPGDGEAFRETGRRLVERREASRAERYLRRAVALDPEDAAAWRLLAQAHEAIGRPLEARDDLQQILRLEPEDPATLLGLGRVALHAGDVEQGREWLGRYLAAAPGTGEAVVQAATLWLAAGRPADALQVALETPVEPGAAPRVRLAEGLALAGLRRWDEAARALEEVGPEVEGYPAARVALADALSRSGRHAEAERALAEPLRAHPEDARLVLAQAAVLERAGRGGAAATLIDRSAAERERAGDAGAVAELTAALGATLARAGRTGEAVDALERAVVAHPRSEPLLYALGVAYGQAGFGERAAAQMRALLALAPDHPEALSYLARSLAERGQRLEEAERLARRAVELAPRSPQALDALAAVLVRRGDGPGALSALEHADAMGGNDLRVVEHLGDAYRAAGRPADAAAAWRRALAGAAEEPPAVAVQLRGSLERKLREVDPARPAPRERAQAQPAPPRSP